MASGMKNFSMALIYEIRKCLVVNIKAGRGCGADCVNSFVCD